MGLFDFFKLKKRDQYLGGSTPIMVGNGKAIPTPYMSVAKALYQNSDVYAVLNRIASDVASCPMVCQSPSTQAQLANPNHIMAGFNFWQKVLAQLLLYGNAIVTMGDNFEMVPFDNVSCVLKDQSAGMYYEVTYTDGRPRMRWDNDEVLHFRLLTTGSMDGNSQYIGISPLQSLAEDLALQDLSKQLTQNVLKNGLAPRFKLTAPTVLNPDNMRELREGFERLNMGENANRPIVLDQGLQIDTIGLPQDVSDYLKNYSFSQNQVAKAFGIPSNYLNGEGDKQSSVEMLRSMYADSLQTYIKPIEAELSFKLHTRVKLDILGAIDVDNSNLIQQLVQLTSGTEPILDVGTARQILTDRGFLDGK